MAKSKINVRFIAIFSAIVVLGIAFAGFVIWWQKVAGPERNFATAERYEQAGDYRKAASFLGRAVNKQQTNVKYLDAYESALQRIVPTTFGMGFMTHGQFTPYAGPGSYGHPGAGGSVAFAQPERQLAFGYVMNQMAKNLAADVRAQRLTDAAAACADALVT